MIHSILHWVRFPYKQTVLVLSFVTICAFSGTLSAQSFSITEDHVYGPVIPPYNQIISINNLAGKTQYLTVTVVNPDSSLQFEMLNIKSEVVPLGNLLVLHKDSTGWDHGTFLFSHPRMTSRKFTTFVVFTDASNTTSDTLTFNVADSLPPQKKQIMSISPAGPITLYVGKDANTSFDLTFTNLIVQTYPVSIDLSNASNLFSINVSSFELNGKSGANTYTLTINYQNRGQNYPDSGEIIFTPSVQGGESQSIMVYVIDTVKNPPNIGISAGGFYNVPIGTKSCDNITITNYGNVPVIITSLGMSGADAAEFSLSPAPTLPMTIGANSIVQLPYCFSAPNSRHSDSRAELDITYHADGTVDEIARGFLYGLTESCVIFTPDSLQFGDLIAGGNADGEVTITNTLDNAVTLTGDSWQQYPANEFILVGTSFPIQLASKESKTLKFHWVPSGKTDEYSGGQYMINYTGSGDSLCTFAYMGVVGHVVDPSDTSTKEYQLFPNVKSAMPVVSDQQTTTKDFIFYNNTTNPVKVISVSVKDGTHFAVVTPTSSDLPITLKPGDQMKVTLSFDANTNGYYNDELDIVTENGITSQAFSLQGIRKNGITAGVATSEALAPQISLSPNPSQGLVTIDIAGAGTRSIEIYDMLGSMIATYKNSNLWMWDGVQTNGQLARQGTYFVRASGLTDTGTPFVTTTKLVLDR
jgi:hypothetical protein